MKEAVEMIVKSLVDDVEAVDVREVEPGATLIEVRVARGHGKDDRQAGTDVTRLALPGLRGQFEEKTSLRS